MRNPTPAQAKKHLARQGWSQRQAARSIGRCYQHLNEVLNGRRASRRLLDALLSLPANPNREDAIR